MPFYCTVYGGGIHLIDLMRWLINDEVKEVCSMGNNLLTNGRKDVRMEHEGCTLRDEGSNVEKWGLNVWFSL